MRRPANLKQNFVVPTDRVLVLVKIIIIIIIIFRKWDVGAWIGSNWLRIGTGGGHL